MIVATIFKNSDGVINGFSVSGHAGFSEKGSDIVCSAVSLLVINTINSIEALTDCKAISEEYEENGIIKCALPDINEDAELLINSMVLGLETLQNQYRKYIRLTEEHQND